MADPKKLEQIGNSMKDFFKTQKSLKEGPDTEREIIQKRFQEALTGDTNQADSMTTFFKNELKEIKEDDKRRLDTKETRASPWKKKGDPKNAFTRKDMTDKDKERLFLEYYDENLKLKANQTKLDQHIKELKTKLRVIEGEYNYSRKKYEGNELVKEDLQFIDELKRENALLKAQLKEAQFPKPQFPSKNQKVIVKTVNKGVPNKTLSEQLRLIDMLKMRNKKLEEEIQALHGKMARSHVETPGDNRSFVSRQQQDNLRAGYESQKAAYERTKQALDEVSQQLFEERRKVANLEIELRSLQGKAAENRDLQAMLDEAKSEKRMLEARIKDLTSSPFFKDMDGAHPARLRETQEQLNESKKKYDEMREQLSKYEKEIIELKAQLRSVTEERDKFRDEKVKYETLFMERDKNQAFFGEQMKMFNISTDRDKDNFLKALGTVMLKGEEPAWKRIEFIERYKEVDPKDVPAILKELDRLKIEKSELAAQLEKAQALLQTHLEIEKEKDTIHEAEIRKLQLQLKSANNRIDELVKLADFRAKSYKEMMAKGAGPFQAYDEGADDFSEISESDIHVGENTFDLLVSECEFDELVVRKILEGKVLDLNGLATVLAVDFYNHDTQTSNVCEGLRPAYNFQLAYRVSVDENLIQYMENESLKVEIYATVGSELVLLGTAYAPYRELLIKNYDVQFGTSAIVSINSIVYGERKSDIVGVLKLKMRMRHPISETLRMIKEKEELMREAPQADNIFLDPTLKSRRLIVQVQKAVLSDSKLQTFAFFKFYNLKDVVTQTIPSAEPLFNHVSTLEVPQNESVKAYLKNEYLEFVIFDDSQPLKSQTKTGVPHDIVGKTKVRLSALLNDETIDQVLPILSLRGGNVGSLHVKIYWYDSDPTKISVTAKESNLTNMWDETMTRNIASTLASKGQTVETAFRMFDADEDGLISFEEFKWGILRTFRVRVPEDEVNLYWNRFKLTNGKLSKEEFYMKFAPYLSDDSNLQVTKNILKDLDHKNKLSQINRLLDMNTEKLTGKISSDCLTLFARQLAYYCRANNCTADHILEKFDRDGSGNISRIELKGVINGLNIHLSSTHLEELLEYFDVNNDNRISLLEFKALVKPELIKEMNILEMEAAPRHSDDKKEILRTVTKFIFDYIRKHNIPLEKFASRIDPQNTGTITRENFTAFFKTIGAPLQPKEVAAVFSEIDPYNTNNVSIPRFIELIKPFINEKPIITSDIKNSLKALAFHMKKNNLDSYKFFNDIDKDKNGFIERNELRAALFATGAFPTDVQLNNLLSYFDYSGDNRISVKEFSEAIDPYIATVSFTRESSANLNNPKAREIRKKCKEIFSKGTNYDLTLQSMGMWKEKNGLITKEDFKKVLISLNLGFLPSDVDLILDNLVDYEDNYVKYLVFLNKFKEDDEYAESQYVPSMANSGVMKKSASAENLFRRMNKVLKEAKISPREAFKIFDKNKDGKISLQEFRDAFHQMKLGMTDEEISDVIKHIDKTKDGNIDYNEFLAALKL